MTQHHNHDGLQPDLVHQRYASFEEASNAILHLIADLVGMRSSFLAHANRAEVRVVSSFNQGGCAVPVSTTAQLSEWFCQHVIATRKPLLINDAAQDPRVSHLPSRLHYNVGSYLGVPIILGDGSLYGTLCTLDPEPHALTEQHVQTMQMASQLISFYLDQQATEQRTAEQVAVLEELNMQLMTTNQALQASTEHKTRFLSSMSHEMRTPMTAILGYANLLELGLAGSLSEMQRDSINRIKRNAQRLLSLINDLLDLSKIEAGHLRIDLQPLEIRSLAQDVIGLLEGLAQDKGLRLILQIDPATPIEITNDASRLQQILVNLISNAIKFTPAGEVRLEIAPLAEDRIALSVIDTGPGIAPVDQERVWEEFQQGQGARPGTGTGLGLPIVRQLTRLMGGEIRLTSELGAGSTFRVELPIICRPSQN